jgi:hypothetical protein
MVDRHNAAHACIVAFDIERWGVIKWRQLVDQ